MRYLALGFVLTAMAACQPISAATTAPLDTSDTIDVDTSAPDINPVPDTSTTTDVTEDVGIVLDARPDMDVKADPDTDPPATTCGNEICEPGEDPTLCPADCGSGCLPNECGGDCGPCATGDTCLDGQCVCTPQCAGKQCGTDGCDADCGTCNTNENCSNNGTCEAIATECVATKCGDCGHWDCWLWYSPSNAATAGGTLPDFMDLFDNEQQWANIRAKTGVLFLRAVTLKKWKTTGFIENTLVPKLNEWGIQLALDVSGATWAKCWADPMTKLNGEIALLNQIQAAGGSVQYLGMQSVLSKPLPATLPEAMQANCPPYTMEDRYQDVAMYVNGMKNAFPDTQVGIVDAMLAHGDDAQAAYTALTDVLAGQGLALDFVLFDHPYHYGEKSGATSWAALQSLEAFVRNDLGVPTGLYHVSSTGGKASEKQFHDEVLLTQDHFAAVGGTPDYHILSSWYPFPTNELPENAAAPQYPMTKVLAALASHIEGDNTLPKGHIGTVNAKNVLTGWALDADNPLLSIAVAVYTDGSQSTGTHLGDFLADIPRPDVNAVTGLPGDHGFEIPIPGALQDGQTHTIHVYALDSRGMALPKMLPESPYAFVAGP